MNKEEIEELNKTYLYIDKYGNHIEHRIDQETIIDKINEIIRKINGNNYE